MKTTVHIISHSHWDREWYMAFEQHRMKLVELMDQTMELFEKDDSFRSFHLDGQTIILDDYLEIKPQNREKVEKYIKEGRFSAGPWYILQDEFLTSGESNVRNLLVGMKEAERYGEICKIGYFPDAFGNAGQMPQLLKQAGMKAVVFGRGVKPVGFNNETLEGGEYESAYSEMIWRSPNGSALPGILFANWYNNGAEIPVDPEQAKVFWDEGLAKVRQFASTGHLLFMNGCDHQPVQKDLTAAIETARKLYPDIEFIHSDFNTYIDAVSSELKEDISTVKGELTSQETDGLWTLVNTTSSRIPLKQMNRVCETALEKEAEPMAVMASLMGKSYPKELLLYSWKTLMQNHPHDSICGCSVDSVNEEMKIRFDKSRQVSKELFKESMIWLAGKIDTAGLTDRETGNSYPFAVFNTTGWSKSEVVSLLIDIERSYGRDLSERYKRVSGLKMPALVLKDASGNAVKARIEDAGTSFGYDLPNDKFRQPYMARQVRVTFEAKDIPALGYSTYYLKEQEQEAEPDFESLVTGNHVMENDFLKVEIHDDGTYSLTEKETGRIYSRIGYYEESGDIGNEYIYIQNPGNEKITTKGLKAEIELLENEVYGCTYRIIHRLDVPKGADNMLEEERRMFLDFYQRKAPRSKDTVTLTITTLLTLERSEKGLKVETTIENTAKDHRIRVIVPTGLEADTHFVDSNFEVVERNNRHSRAWKNLSACEHQQNFVAMSDGKCGILVANFGLYEYEVLPDMHNAIAVTLLRATGEMGDWGVFPAPAAQLQGTHTVNYKILPFKGEDIRKAYTKGHQCQTHLASCQIAVSEGTLPASCSFLKWSGEGLNLTGLKQKEEGEDVIVRFVNETKEPITLSLERQDWFDSVYQSNVIEENLGEIEQGEDFHYHRLVKPFEILTIGIIVKKQM
ncbi:MAG: alpha-mannosidase [Lachnospiraceae bacterium]|nr:alpha-mannosidase [Lachnospiraceae bacterium]